MTGYLNIFKDGSRKMSFLSDNNEFLKRYTAIWEKISDLVNRKYYPQTLLKECVYKLINKKVENIITNINLDSSSKSDSESDYE